MIRENPRSDRLQMAVIWCAVISLLAASGPPHAVAQSAKDVQPTRIPDSDIVNAINEELLRTLDISLHEVSVRSTDGIVTLSGIVDNIRDRDRALESAKMIKGVRSVLNDISVHPASRSDDGIQRAIRLALTEDPATESYDVSVSVHSGIAELSGVTQSWGEKLLAEDVTKGVTGVRDVVNSITVSALHDRPSEEIAVEIRRMLGEDMRVDDGLVKVDVAHGNVVLHGSVGSAYEKDRAVQDASIVAGVRSVQDSLEVRWWLHDGMKRGAQAPETDEQIRNAVLDAFRYEPRLSGFSPVVDVRNGEIVLTGTVSNLAAKRAAEMAARNTIGAVGVMNHLHVLPATPPQDTRDQHDAALANTIRKNIKEDPRLNRAQIAVNVANGKAYLYGAVNSFSKRIAAEDIVARVPGIIGLQDRIEIGPSHSTLSDTEITHGIRSRLEWNALLKSDRITIDVQNGFVRLEGTVDHWIERTMATRAAYASGAFGVRNELEVRDDLLTDGEPVNGRTARPTTK